MEPKYIKNQVNLILRHLEYNKSEKGVTLKELKNLINRMHWTHFERIHEIKEITESVSKDKHFIVNGKYIKVIK